MNDDPGKLGDFGLRALTIPRISWIIYHRPGQPPVSELQDAYRLLSPLLGTTAAGTVFGIGLIASGLSSSITGTLAGQVVMEGFHDIRVSRGRRALVTRALALLPAVAVTIGFGHGGHPSQPPYCGPSRLR
jgi:manganese transport protein